MIRRADHHGIQSLLVRQHLAVVFVKRPTRISLRHRRLMLLLHIAKRGDLHIGKASEITCDAAALTTDAHAADVQLLRRRRHPRRPEHMTRDDVKTENSGSSSDEVAASGYGLEVLFHRMAGSWLMQIVNTPA
jgi:hypothetical protein